MPESQNLQPGGPPTEDVLSWVQAVLGPVRVLSRFSHIHAYSQLWRLEAQGQNVWLKMHSQERKWAGEVGALTRWTPSLGLTPEVLGYRQEPFAVLLTEVPGTDAEKTTFDLYSEETMWAAAGDWLRRLHARENVWLGNATIEGAPDGLPSYDPVSFVGATIERRLAEAVPLDLFSTDERDFIVRASADLLPSLERETAVAIHRDFTPRNWLVDEAGNLSGIIDFEHSRWDVRAADLNRPPDNEFLRNPRLRDAFFEAYGKPNARLKAQIQALRLVQAVAAIVWGVLVKEFDYSIVNREALHRMMTEQTPNESRSWQ